MNKRELVDQLAKRAGITKRDAGIALDSLVNVITESLADDKEVAITGFGRFTPRPRRSSRRINPQTRAKITVPKVVPGFKPGKHLREKVMKNLRVVEVGGKLQTRR